MLESEVLLFTGPQAEKLKQAEIFEMQQRSDEAAALYEEVRKARGDDRSIRSYLDLRVRALDPPPKPGIYEAENAQVFTFTFGQGETTTSTTPAATPPVQAPPARGTTRTPAGIR